VFLVERLIEKRRALLRYNNFAFTSYRRRLCSMWVLALARPRTHTLHNFPLRKYKIHYLDKNIAGVYRRNRLMQNKQRKQLSSTATVLTKEQH
jgi:hypothetical protein